MTHQEKVARIVSELKAKGISEASIAPPLWRLMWKFGFDVRPPFFMSFASITLLLGSFFGVFWGVTMWFWQWKKQGIPVVGAVIGSLVAGAMFGVLMAIYLRWRAKKLGLPSWEEYGKDSN